MRRGGIKYRVRFSTSKRWQEGGATTYARVHARVAVRASGTAEHREVVVVVTAIKRE